MKLSDVKKLKVLELRAELKERGLETKGLKVDLVARLWAALENQSDGQPPSVGEDSSVTGGIPLDIKEKQEHNNTPEIQSDHQPEVCAQTDKDVVPQAAVLDNSLSKEEAASSQEIGTNSDDLQSVWNDGGVSKSNVVYMIPTGHTVKSVTRQHKVRLSSRRLSPNVVSGESFCQLTATKDVFNTTVTESASVIATESRNLSTCHTVNEEGEQKNRTLSERDRNYYEFKEEVRYNRAKTPDSNTVCEDSGLDEDRVVLDPYNSDLHFEVGQDGTGGHPLFWDRFPLLWSGCRLSHGVRCGKVSFEVKYVQRLMSSSHEWEERDPEPWVLRVGWSTDDASLQLSETELSYGFDSRGWKVTEGRREDFGEPFSEGDIIGCYAWIRDSGQSEFSFFKNGRSLGVAFRLDTSRLKSRVLYPHVLCKNCSVALNLDPRALPWHQGPIGFTTLPALQPPKRIAAPRPPPSREDCEVVMMVGMPGVGKSRWAQAHVAQHPDKRYLLLGTDAVLACMRPEEAERYAPRQQLLQQATQCVTELIKVAAGRRGNYILDQANVYASARRHKMLLFSGFRRRAVVVFPSERDWHTRLAQQQGEGGSAMPYETLLKVKATFTLPEGGDLLEEVLFAEQAREEAQRLLAEYKENARELLPTPPKRKKHKQKYKHKHYYRPPAQAWKTYWNAPYRREPGWMSQPPRVPTPYWGPAPCGRWDMYDQIRPSNYNYYGAQWTPHYRAPGHFSDCRCTCQAFW